MAGDLVPQEAPEIYDFGFLCSSTIVQLFLGERNLEAGAAGERDK